MPLHQGTTRQVHAEVYEVKPHSFPACSMTLTLETCHILSLVRLPSLVGNQERKIKPLTLAPCPIKATLSAQGPTRHRRYLSFWSFSTTIHFISFHSLAAWRPLCPSKTRLNARGPRIRPGGTSHGPSHDSHPPDGTSPPSRDAGLDPLLGGAESYSDPAAVLRRAVAHEGDMLRLHRLLHKVTGMQHRAAPNRSPALLQC